MNSYRILTTSMLGDLLLLADESHLLGIYFADCKHAPAIDRAWRLEPGQPILAEASRQMESYLTGDLAEFSLPLRHEGTDFQRSVWREIAGIPRGQTITYSDLAGRAGGPTAIRAAGTATGRNALSIVVPCHRVLAKGGTLGGYAGGLERKRRLLELEQAAQDLFTKSQTRSLEPAELG